MASAVSALQIAIDGAILGDATLAAKLAGDKVYSLVAPELSPRPFIILGNSSERPFPLFQRGANDGEEDIHVYSKQLVKKEVISIYHDLYRILHGTLLTITGHTLIRGRMSLLAIILDENGQGTHLAARYSLLTRNQ